MILRSDNGKAALTVRQFTNHLLNLKIDTLDKRNITSKHLGRRGLHLNQSGSNLLTKNIISKLRKFWKSNRSTKSWEARNFNNENEKVFSENFNMESQSPEKVSIYSHELTFTQNTSLSTQNSPSNLTINNSNLYQ